MITKQTVRLVVNKVLFFSSLFLLDCGDELGNLH